MRLLEEGRRLRDAQLKKELAHAKAQHAKESVQRRKHLREVWKGTSQRKPWNVCVASQIAEEGFLGVMLKQLRGDVEASNKTLMEPLRDANTSPLRQDSTFDRVKVQWGAGERWMDEREWILGPRPEAHVLTLTSHQRKLVGNYRIQSVSKVLWEVEATAAALSFQKQHQQGY
ncbi:putative myosin heavy chain MYA2-related [Trypanosoma conorhini]|uniref:Putative myosin heavy chain MYA2-related n=1 Tax=Trypanosoma conorhini TaxID=83891 RepID=A0A3R7LWE5_9TRYP|nr:putative myosin heavy chain MYA2-related [Trypanosoma conorhini]RNF21919.1 putative myosin heavy chain MYA2-related [Trypanosoma conorhini]